MGESTESLDTKHKVDSDTETVVIDDNGEYLRATMDADTDTPTVDHTGSTESGNKFVSKKTIVQGAAEILLPGMFDVALLSSNTNQLVQLVESIRDDMKPSKFHSLAIVLLIISIILQIVVGACLMVIVFLSTPERRKSVQTKTLKRRLSNATTLLIFFITVINVLIPSFTPHHYTYSSDLTVAKPENLESPNCSCEGTTSHPSRPAIAEGIL